MSKSNKHLFEKLYNHIGHNIALVKYIDTRLDGDVIHNISIECEDCMEVLIDVNNPTR